jgi:Disulphide bond corrector protein DsbC/AhpC/TSA family
VRYHIVPFAISYDAVDVLAAFATKQHITYTLLSDVGSKVIRALGLLNEHVYEHHAAYGVPKRDQHWGVPYPGILLLDEHGSVVQKRFQQSYRERETGVAILERGFGLSSSVHGAPVQAQAQGVWVTARLDSPTYRVFQRLWLTIDMDIDAGLHVYGQPIPEGLHALTVAVAPRQGLVVGAAEFPPPTLHRIEGLDEEFYIYEGKLTVTLPLTFTDDADDVTVQVTVRYQACSDELGCFMPQTVTLPVPVPVQDHVDRPRQR